MAHTALDAWYQHIAGPALLAVIVMVPGVVLLPVALFVGADLPDQYIRGYMGAFGGLAAVVVVSALAGNRSSKSDDRGQVAVDPFWPPVLIVSLGLGLLVVLDIMGAV